MSVKIIESDAQVLSRIKKTVDVFLKDWEASAFQYETEADIHFELASRLKGELKEAGRMTQNVYYEKYDWIDVSLLGCCYPIEFDENDPSKSYCLPDIQVLKLADDPYHPYDSIGRKNWPALWICEIKYKTELQSTQYKKYWNNDEEKLRRIPTKTAEHCYILHLERKEDGDKVKTIYEYRELERNFRGHTT